jgi:vacuolar-type H+-ATPase subunit E/Vma4
MITIEEKLKVFARLVIGNARQDSKEKLSEAAQENERIIEEKRVRAQETGQRIISELTQKGRVQRNKTISRALQQNKNRIMQKKQQLADRLFENIKKEAAAFTTEPAYRDFFVRCLCEAFSALRDEDSICVMAAEEDVRRFEEDIYLEGERNGFLREQIHLAVSGEDIIGGVVAVSGKGDLRVDYSIITMLEEQKKTVARSLYDALERTVDENE